jgi:hypothetical protein
VARISFKRARCVHGALTTRSTASGTWSSCILRAKKLEQTKQKQRRQRSYLQPLHGSGCPGAAASGFLRFDMTPAGFYKTFYSGFTLSQAGVEVDRAEAVGWVGAFSLFFPHNKGGLVGLLVARRFAQAARRRSN